MYETVFVISSKPEGYLFLTLAGGVITFLCAYIEYGRYRKGEMTRVAFIKCRSIIPLVPLGILFLAFLILNVSCITSWYTSNSAYKNGRYNIAEGDVFVLREQPKEGRGEGDIIKIGNTRLNIDPYSTFRNASAYKKTIAFGGVLKHGVYARIYHYEGKILRIDIKEEEPTTGHQSDLD